MKKAEIVILNIAMLAFLTACGENEVTKSESPKKTNTPIQIETKEETKNEKVFLEENKAANNFEKGIMFDLASYKDQLPKRVYNILEINLNALLEYDHSAFNSVFVDDYASEYSNFYYNEDYQYQFTEIEKIAPIEQNRYDITVIGQRLETSNLTIHNVKMMYSIQTAKDGEWYLYIID